jgi:predicted molibdopterin-dependent oxidoreductase YjgC
MSRRRHIAETRTNRLTTDVVDRLADCREYKVTPVEVCSLRRDA